jgi:hypothetical protein
MTTRSKIEVFSMVNVIIGILFYLFILGENILGKRILLFALIILNSICLIVNIKNFNQYRTDTYITYRGYLATLGFIVITFVLAVLEFIK